MITVSPNVLSSQKDDIKLFLEELRMKEIASQLSAVREKKQLTGSASQPRARKKHKQDFGLLSNNAFLFIAQPALPRHFSDTLLFLLLLFTEYLIAKFEKSNSKCYNPQLRRTGKRFRRFIRYVWGVGGAPPSHLMFLSKTGKVNR